MEAHVKAGETCIITAKTVLDLAKRAKELFMSSKMSEKHKLLNFVFSNLKLDGNKLSVTLSEPFSTILALSHQQANSSYWLSYELSTGSASLKALEAISL